MSWFGNYGTLITKADVEVFGSRSHSHSFAGRDGKLMQNKKENYANNYKQVRPENEVWDRDSRPEKETGRW